MVRGAMPKSVTLLAELSERHCTSTDRCQAVQHDPRHCAKYVALRVKATAMREAMPASVCWKSHVEYPHRKDI